MGRRPPCWLGFQGLASRTVREDNSAVLIHRPGGKFLQQSCDTYFQEPLQISLQMAVKQGTSRRDSKIYRWIWGSRSSSLSPANGSSSWLSQPSSLCVPKRNGSLRETNKYKINISRSKHLTRFGPETPLHSS